MPIQLDRVSGGVTTENTLHHPINAFVLALYVPVEVHPAAKPLATNLTTKRGPVLCLLKVLLEVV